MTRAKLQEITSEILIDNVQLSGHSHHIVGWVKENKIR